MTLAEIKSIIEPLLPINPGEKIEAELTYTKVETPKRELLKDLSGSPASIKKVHTIICELGINYGNTKYAKVKNANRAASETDIAVAGEKKTRANNKVWDIKDILGTNSNTGNSNLEVYVDRSKNFIISSQYDVTYEDGTEESMTTLSQRAKDMRRPEKPFTSEKDSDGNEVYMPLVTIGIDKIDKLDARKVVGRYNVGED